MKNIKKIIQRTLKVTVVACILTASITSCDDNDDDGGPSLTGESKIYTLNSVSDPAISGTVKFEERSDNSTVVTIDLDGTASGNTHIAHIHENSAAETGGILVDLNSIDGSNGISETVVKKLNDGTDITYSEILMLNSYVNVHVSSTDLATLVAQGDIGENELTSASTTYALSASNGSGVDGTVVFSQRISGATLVTVNLNGASLTSNYPISIYDNSVTTTGPIAISLNNYTGSTGTSVTTVRTLNNNTAISYDQLTDFNGHVIVETSATDPEHIALGNIGSN
jgi:hypothetical protein